MARITKIRNFRCLYDFCHLFAYQLYLDDELVNIVRNIDNVHEFPSDDREYNVDHVWYILSAYVQDVSTLPRVDCLLDPYVVDKFEVELKYFLLHNLNNIEQ